MEDQVIVDANTSTANTQAAGSPRPSLPVSDRGVTNPPPTNRLPPPQQQIFGGDGAQLMGLHKSDAESLAVPVRPTKANKADLNFEELINESSLNTARKYTAGIGDFLRSSGGAFKNIFSHLGGITNLGLDKATGSPNTITIGAGLIGLIAGIKGIKNVLGGIADLIDQKRSPEISWVFPIVLGISEGGLAAGLLAKFFNKRNIFTQVQDGQEIVRMKTLAGATLFPILFATFINLAKGISWLRNIPLIGDPLVDICKTLAGGIRQVTVSTEENKQGAGAGAGMPGLGGATP